MSETVVGLIQRYRSRGVLVDTNILLLHFVGRFNRELIPRFKRTAQFTVDDYQLLSRLLGRFDKIVTTPHVLSEVNSLSGQLGDPARTEYFGCFARDIATLDEQYVQSAAAAATNQFSRLGLTDSGIMLLAKGTYLVLTDDLKLTNYLERADIDVINFNHVRLAHWTGHSG
jgi:rRNA-processing protein FCF1